MEQWGIRALNIAAALLIRCYRAARGRILRWSPPAIRYLLEYTDFRLRGTSLGAVRHLPWGVGIHQFFQILDRRGIRYVVLESPETQWRDNNLPWKLLLDEAGNHGIADLFSWSTSGVLIHLHTISGVGRTGFHTVPYFPPPLAREVLRTRTQSQDGFSVPSLQYHVLSFLYHIVFHLGSQAFTAASQIDGGQALRPQYNAALNQLCVMADAPIPSTYRQMHSFLAHAGWHPPLDVLRKLAIHDPWIMSLLPETRPLAGEVMVFVVREWGTRPDRVEIIRSKLIKNRIEILMQLSLASDQRRRARETVRGGKWGRAGGWVDGGNPAALLVCYDPHPLPPKPAQLKEHPFQTNGKMLVKKQIRTALKNSTPFWNHAHVLHSADDEQEAWEYVAAILPEQVTEIQAIVTKRRAQTRCQERPPRDSSVPHSDRRRSHCRTFGEKE